MISKKLGLELNLKTLDEFLELCQELKIGINFIILAYEQNTQ